MSLLDELETRGVTAEDLEKAASVRLFEKAAAAEGVDLDLLDVEQVEDLYTAFLSNQSDTDNTKEASAMNDEIVDLFEKTASAEGINLDEMADHELAELYNHYVENVLPVQVDEYEKGASYDEVDEATEKLAEAEILGRHMARSYMDEFEKEAREGDMGRMGQAIKEEGAAGRDAVKRGYQGAKSRASSAYQSGKARAGRAYESGKDMARRGGAAAASGARSYGKALRGDELRAALKQMSAQQSTKGFAGGQRVQMMRRAMRGGAKTTAAYGGLAAAGYGAKKGYDKMSKKSSIDDIIEDRANELLGEFLFESGVDLD
jgi:hypothetical protein